MKRLTPFQKEVRDLLIEGGKATAENISMRLSVRGGRLRRWSKAAYKANAERALDRLVELGCAKREPASTSPHSRAWLYRPVEA